MMHRTLTSLFLCSVIAGCGIFGDKDDELPPLDLTKFDETLDVRKLWSTKVGKGSELLRINLMPAGDGKRIYAASHDGKVSAYDPETGKLSWRNELEIRLSAGPGVGEGLVIVAGTDGDVVALKSDDGSIAWQRNVAGEMLSVPQVRNGVVVIYTIDGRLMGLSALTGKESWMVEQDLPALTLRGAATPQIAGNLVVAGFDNGRLVATTLANGETEWEAMLSPPTGRSDLERLSDVDGTIAVVGQDVYAAGFQGRIASLAAESGQVMWAREISTYTGIGADWNNVYLVSEEGEVIALTRRSGSDAWRQLQLLRRTPTTPVPFNATGVVGDFEGYVHFLSNTDGTFVARERVGKSMISGAPVTIGSTLYVQSEDGTLTAFAVAKPKPPKNQSVPTESR
jgi:outer membrane protein assembly factor BamB